MSKHDGVTCDSCSKVAFSGHRYKCLICYDYDLCQECYSKGATSSRHKADHAMQCILTRQDMSVYFGGEGSGTAHPHQSFTCPYCGKLGFSVPQLQEHTRTNHTDIISIEIICPICAVLPNGDPNLVTEDLVGHIYQAHTNKNIDQAAFESSFLDEATGALTSQPGNFRQIRRLNHPTRMASFGTTTSQPSTLRTTSRPVPMQIIESALSPRDPIDPIAELLSQLTNGRPRGTASSNNGGAIASHLQHLELQLATTRQQLERFRQVESLARSAVASGTNSTQAPSNSSTGTAGKALESTPEGGTNRKSEERKGEVEGDNRFLMRRGSNLGNQSDSSADDDPTNQLLRQEYVRQLVLCTLFPTYPEVRGSTARPPPPKLPPPPREISPQKEAVTEVFGAAFQKKLTPDDEEFYWSSDEEGAELEKPRANYRRF